MAKGKSSEIAQLNSYLEQIRSQLTGYYQELALEKVVITPDAIKDKFYGIDETGKTLKELVEYHNVSMGLNLKWEHSKTIILLQDILNCSYKKV